MKKILVALLLCFLPLSRAFALDPTCEPFLKAVEARMQAPAWQSHTEVGSKLTIEAMKVGGQYFTRMNGKEWTKSSTNIDDTEKQFLNQIKTGAIKLSACKDAGKETVDGVETIAMTYRMELTGQPPANVKLNIGSSDGLPYAQTSETILPSGLTQTTIKAKYRYSNIQTPKL